MSPKSCADESIRAEGESLQKKAARGAGASVFAQMISFAVQTAGIVVLARLLTPRDFGLVTMVTAFSMLAMNVSVNGFPEYIMQKKDVSDAELSTIFWFSIAISTLLMIAFFSAGPLIAAFYGSPEITAIAGILSLSILLQALSTTHIALLNRNMEYGKVATNQLVADVLGVTFAILVAQMGGKYWAIVGRQLLISVLLAVGGWLMCRWRPGMPRNVKSMMDSVRYAMRVYGNFVVGYLGRNLDKMLLGRYHGMAVLGNYDRAYYLSTLPANQLVTPIHNVALSTLSRLRDDRNRYFRYYLFAISNIAFLGMLASLVLMLLGKEIIFILLGPGWEEAGFVAVAFGPGVGAMMIYSTCSWLHLSLGKPERWLRWSIASSIATAVLFVIAAPLGAVTLATAYSFSFYLYLIPATWYAGMPIRLGAKPLCLAIWHYVAAALTAWVIWATSMVWIPDIHCILNSLSALQRICIVLPAILIVYVLLVVGFQRNADSLRQLSFLVKTTLGKGKTV